MILDDGGDATMLLHLGVEAEKNGVAPDPATAASARAAHRLRGARRPARAQPDALDPDRERGQGRHRGDHHRCAASLRHDARRHAALPGDQRQRLGHQEQVRQQVRLPPLAHRRHQPRHRRAHRRQGRRGLRLRRRRQGLRGVAARPGRPRHRHRDRPDLRAAGRHGRLPGLHARRGPPGRRHHHHRDRQQGRRDRRADAADEVPGDRGQHRPLRQRDRHGRPGVLRGRRPQERQAAGRRVVLPRGHHHHRAVRGPPDEPRQRDRATRRS